MRRGTAYEHGNYLRYYSAKCRCALCREAANAYSRDRRARHVAERQAAEQRGQQYVPQGLTHGCAATYNAGSCRCDACRVAMQRYRSRTRAS